MEGLLDEINRNSDSWYEEHPRDDFSPLIARDSGQAVSSDLGTVQVASFVVRAKVDLYTCVVISSCWHRGYVSCDLESRCFAGAGNHVSKSHMRSSGRAASRGPATTAVLPLPAPRPSDGALSFDSRVHQHQIESAGARGWPISLRKQRLGALSCQPTGFQGCHSVYFRVSQAIETATACREYCHVYSLCRDHRPDKVGEMINLYMRFNITLSRALVDLRSIQSRTQMVRLFVCLELY